MLIEVSFLIFSSHILSCTNNNSFVNILHSMSVYFYDVDLPKSLYILLMFISCFALRLRFFSKHSITYVSYIYMKRGALRFSCYTNLDKTSVTGCIEFVSNYSRKVARLYLGIFSSGFFFPATRWLMISEGMKMIAGQMVFLR